MRRCNMILSAGLTFVAFVVLIGDCDAAGCKKSITRVSGAQAPKGKICSGQLIFREDFDKLDLERWQHESTLWGGGNWEFQWYTNNRSVSYVENGKLHIKPTFVSDDFGNDFLYRGTIDLSGGTLYETCTNSRDWGCSRTGTRNNLLNPIKSARIRTVYSFGFTYGKVEVRAKMPSGDWLWPVILLMPRFGHYGSWPASGAITIAESRGNSELISPSNVDIGNKLVGSTLHFGPSYAYNRWNAAHFETSNEIGFDKSFHKYQLEWTDSYLKFSVDDIEIGRTEPNDGGFWELGYLNNSGLENPWRNAGKMAPFNEEFYIIINLAVGGVNSYFPDDAKNGMGAKPWNNSSPTAYKEFWEGRSTWEPTWNRDTDGSHFQIDYVKVWSI